MKIINLKQIKKILGSVDNIIACIEDAFVIYSSNEAVIPPVGELIFNNPPGDVHIKYGYIVNDDYYVIKIASGFYKNPEINLPSSNGLQLIFCQKTGKTLAILCDEGYLTDIRTAAAGMIAAKYLAPAKITKIGIVGTGIQAKLQLSFLKQTTSCRDVFVWGRSEDKLSNFKFEMEKEGFSVEMTKNISDVTLYCNLIVTTTPSTKALLFAEQIQAGTHITAVGADSPHKQELDSEIFNKADIIVVDSVSQAIERGDVSHAIKKGITKKERLVELGNVIKTPNLGRSSDTQITVADLTGLAVQDIQIAKLVYVNSKEFSEIV